MGRQPQTGPGPFRSSQLREGDRYELSDGHPIARMPAGGRRSRARGAGARVLATDPAVAGAVGVDVGITWGEERFLRAPDLIVGAVDDSAGWQRTFPPLAVEYADVGQDEDDLRGKIVDLLAGGVPMIWVVRLPEPLRVEVYRRGQAVQVVRSEDSLSAPGILRNSVPVRALVDAAAADAATLRNLLQAHEDFEESKRAGRVEASADALWTVLSVRGFVPSEAQAAAIRDCRDFEVLQRWLARASMAVTVDTVFD